MITATKKLFYWPIMKKDMVDYLPKCLECYQVKVENQHCYEGKTLYGQGKPQQTGVIVEIYSIPTYAI